MKVNKITTIIWTALIAVSVNGQVRQPHSLYFMETIPQISQMNPAFQPRANGYVALPLNLNLDLDLGIAVKDLLQKKGNKWNLPFEKDYDYDKLRKSTGKNGAIINFATDADIFGFGFRAGSGYFSFGVSEHLFLKTSLLPDGIFKIIENGFPEGTTYDFAPMVNSKALGYMQIRIGYSGKVNDKLSVGVNVKPVFGQSTLDSRFDDFKLQTGKDEWKGEVKGSIYSSAPMELIMKEDDETKIADMEFRDFGDYTAGDGINDYILGFHNPGIALDLGAEYKINEKLTVSASLNNLGFISWKTDLNSIDINGGYTFNPIYYDVTSDEDFGELFKTLGDSIADALNYSVGKDKFKTMLTPVLYAGASYSLTPAISLGLLSRTSFGKNSIRQSFNGSVYLQPYSFVAMNLGATYQVKGSIQLGGGFTFFLGPLQFYLLLDQVPVYYSTFTWDNGDKFPYLPEHLKTLTMRVGLNLVFGKHGYVNKPMLDKGKSSWN